MYLAIIPDGDNTSDLSVDPSLKDGGSDQGSLTTLPHSDDAQPEEAENSSKPADLTSVDSQSTDQSQADSQQNSTPPDADSDVRTDANEVSTKSRIL